MRRSSNKKTDLNRLAVEISKIEGGAQNMSIAQIKEVLSCLGVVLYRRKFMEIAVLLHKLLENGAKRKQPLKLK